MGFMDMLGQTGSTIKSMELISEVIQQSGGIGNLVKTFEQRGLGGVVQSWIGTGQNLPINPQQIIAAIGEDKVTALAGKFGMTPQQVQEKLSTLLPQVVDKLSPDGQLKSDGFNLSSLIAIGKSFLKH